MMRKALALLLCAALLIGAAVPAIAQEPAMRDDCLSLDIAFDKETYSLFDEVNATVTVTNLTDRPLGSVELTSRSDTLERSYTEDWGRVIHLLDCGASETLALRWHLSARSDELGFFTRLLLRLYNLLGGFRLLFSHLGGTKVTEKTDGTWIAQVDFGLFGKQTLTFCADYIAYETDAETIASAVALYNSADRENLLFPLVVPSFVQDSVKMNGAAYELPETLKTDAIQALTVSAIRTGLEMKHAALSPAAVRGAAISEEEEGVVQIDLLLCEATDRFDATMENGGAAAQGIWTFGSLSAVFDALGIEVLSGAETITMIYPRQLATLLGYADGTAFMDGRNDQAILRIGDAQLSMDGRTVAVKEFEAALQFGFFLLDPTIFED
ncbi:MAG: hypothetical protein IJK64_01160 [Clostridia bacterium]|nr:hypothetical protein [Clostridia bacterium]